MQRFKRWEIALMVGILCALVGGIQVEQEQRALAENVIRLHVIANSDSAEDQAMKLRVRDAVLEQVRQRCDAVSSVREMEQLLRELLPELERTGQGVVGESCDVKASLERSYFPTKQYESFALPAGEYTALRLELGQAQGQNWWCVAFPPLCVGSAQMDVEQALQAGFFTEDQARLITKEGGAYVLRFHIIDLFGRLKEAVLQEMG